MSNANSDFMGRGQIRKVEGITEYAMDNGLLGDDGETQELRAATASPKN